MIGVDFVTPEDLFREWGRMQSFTTHGKRTYIMRILNSVFEFVHRCANRHSERLRNRSDR